MHYAIRHCSLRKQKVGTLCGCASSLESGMAQFDNHEQRERHKSSSLMLTRGKSISTNTSTEYQRAGLDLGGVTTSVILSVLENIRRCLEKQIEEVSLLLSFS